MLGIYCRTSSSAEHDGVSTIDQQGKAGIDFAERHGFEFKIYEDEGKSGYKIDDDDPFKNRPGFSTLLADIKAKTIDKVWVWEQSRLSRNQLAAAHLYSIFQKHHIILYEKEKEYNVNDPQVKMLMGIFGSVAEYEREQIVSRITRGIHDRIDLGKRTHHKMYGYQKTGYDDSGYQIIKPIKSEIEKLKVDFEEYLKGNSLTGIAFKQHVRHPDTTNFFNTIHKVRQLLEHFEYTGYSLNMKGLELVRQYENFEIDTLSELKDSQYYNPSPYYTEKIVSIEDWIKVRERLRLNKKAFQNKPDTRSARNAIATGLIKCGICGMPFYKKNIKKKITTKSGEEKIYDNDAYHHHSKMSREICSQYPKSFGVGKIDDIFRLFFSYFYLVFDNTKELIEAAQKEIRIRMAELEEIIKTEEKEISGIAKQIKKYNEAIVSDENVDAATILRLEQRITDFEASEKEKSQTLTNNKILLEQERTKFNNNEKKNAYYNTKDKILSFFKADNETQRNELRQVVNECFIYNNILIIVGNKRLFLFSLKEKYLFADVAMENLTDDKVFMANFVRDYDTPIEQSDIFDYMDEGIKKVLEYDKDFLKRYDLGMPLDNRESVRDFLWEYEAKRISNTAVKNINLGLGKYREKIQEAFLNHHINYDLKDMEYFISFANNFLLALNPKGDV